VAVGSDYKTAGNDTKFRSGHGKRGCEVCSGLRVLFLSDIYMGGIVNEEDVVCVIIGITVRNGLQ
jgi:hypothetical protein